ncbi:thioesterase family protein [Hypomontagnella monticulosa]|nr:thioesterase family protein [Hypomontagnella monticulosa]
MASILKDQINLKQTTSHTYTASSHPDWSIGPALHGGCVAAVLHHAAATHLTTTLAAQNQPDVQTLHFEFLRACELSDSAITVTDVKLGAGTSTLQLHLSQGGKLRVVALATSTNFDMSAGPSAPTSWALLPPPKPVPDFELAEAHKPEPNWIPGRINGEIVPGNRRILSLTPRGGPVEGISDVWNRFDGDERIDATYLAMMVDYFPSLSDTLLRTGGLYDDHRNYAITSSWAEKHPGVPATIPNSLREALGETIFNHTVTLDIQFKRRLPKDGVKWAFTRTTTKMLEDGRMDLDVEIFNEKMELLCLSRQFILVLDAKRRFKGGKTKAAL